MIVPRFFTAAFLVVAGSAALCRGLPADPDAAASKQCSAPEYRRLDFWAGDWDVFDVGAPRQTIAHARIDVILGGCALREVYEQTDGLVGQSFTIYDAARKVWHQTWVTNRGQLLTIEGRFEGDRLTLQGLRATRPSTWQVTLGEMPGLDKLQQ